MLMWLALLLLEFPPSSPVLKASVGASACSVSHPAEATGVLPSRPLPLALPAPSLQPAWDTRLPGRLITLELMTAVLTSSCSQCHWAVPQVAVHGG